MIAFRSPGRAAMDPDTIQKIATEVARHLPSYAWMPLLVAVVLMAIAAGVGAFFGEYLKTRGKNFATKADFESLQNQLRANTELVETIRSEISQKDWATREWTNLRRVKLEELLERMHDCSDYLDLCRSRYIDGEEVTERDPHGELDTLVDLYLTELRTEASGFSLAYLKQKQSAIDLRVELLAAGSDLVVRQVAFDKFRGEWTKGYADLQRACATLTTAARELLVEIMGVE
jgi:hypothetical protein